MEKRDSEEQREMTGSCLGSPLINSSAINLESNSQLFLLDHPMLVMPTLQPGNDEE